MGFPDGSDSIENSACNAEDLGLILMSGRSPGEGNDNPFQYPHLENSMVGYMERHGVAKSHTRLSG